MIVYHIGGAHSVPVRIGRKWEWGTRLGLLTIIPPATRIDWDIRGEVHSRSAHLGSRFFAAADLDVPLPKLQLRCGVQDPLLISAIQALQFELRQPCQHGSLYADSVSDLMALHLLHECGRPVVLPHKRGAL